MIWWVRAGFGAAILTLLVLAGQAAVGSTSTAPALSATPTTIAVAAPVPATLTQRPTATPQAVVSRMARTTPTLPTRPAGALPLSITISDAGFAPAQLRVRVGQAVTWRNEGLQSHDVSAPGAGQPTWGSGLLGPSSTFNRAFFRNPGQFDYVCTLHTTMRGRIVVEP